LSHDATKLDVFQELGVEVGQNRATLARHIQFAKKFQNSAKSSGRLLFLFVCAIKEALRSRLF
jgi:hypothetical protein